MSQNDMLARPTRSPAPSPQEERDGERDAEIARLRAERDEERRVNALLQSIVAGTRGLLDAPDFEPALRDWLKMMCEAQGAVSATFYDTVIHDLSGLRTVRALAEWSAPSASGRLAVSFQNPHVFDPRTAAREVEQLKRGRCVVFQMEAYSHGQSAEHVAQGHATTIEAPIMDGDRWIGAVSFDYWERKELNPQDEIILRTAADALASVLKRNELQARLVAEQRARADENAALADILHSVVSATGELVEEPDFERGINRWLATLSEKTDAARAAFFETTGHDLTHPTDLYCLAEWSRPGVEHSVMVSFAHPARIPSTGAEAWWRGIRRGQPIAIHLDDLHGEVRAYTERQGVQTILMVPFRARGTIWAVSFDFLRRRAFDDRTLAILQTAANSIAAEIERRDAETARLDAQNKLAEQRIDAEKAIAEERARIAREIHDTLAQGFTGIILQGEAARARAGLGPQTAMEHMNRAVDLAKFGLSEARRSVLALRPLVLEQKGLSEALADLAERVSVPGFLAVTCAQSGLAGRIDPQLEDALFRVAQEALTNAMRHSGALDVAIRLDRTAEALTLEVSDAGAGFDVAAVQARATGTGLRALASRMERLGGRLAILSAPGQGATIRAELPLSA